MNMACCDRVLLASRGQPGALLRPGKRGFVEFGPLLCDLLAFCLCYDQL